MASKKYYAVRKGRKKGIFSTWDECKASIEGYSGAEYKSFSKEEDAKLFIKNISKISSDKYEKVYDYKTEDIAIAYIDGSYDNNKKLYSYGCIILDDTSTELSGFGNDEDLIGMRNVAGELMGSMEAIKWAIEKNYKKIVINYDYEGIEKWANKSWKANLYGTKKYVEFIDENKKNIEIEFCKVKAHSGDKYNDIADQLAKNALYNSSYEEYKVKEIKVEKKLLEIFEEILKEKEIKKNTLSFLFIDYIISETQIRKFIKETWKYTGRKVSNIDKVNIFINSHTKSIDYTILTKENNEAKESLRF